jgi:hypothetical protein
MSRNEHNFPVGDPDPVIIKIKIGGVWGGWQHVAICDRSHKATPRKEAL